ncbi:MAG: histidine kinase, partial [Bacteroidota bacterium]
NEDLQGSIPEKIYVHKPFGERGLDQEEFVAYSEPSLDWRKLSFQFDLDAEFSSVAFIQLQGHFYPVVIYPYGEREIDWVAEPGHDQLRMQLARDWERDRANGQNFFNRRYPYGLDAVQYRNLVNAFVGDRQSRADTLIAWSRGIEEMFGTQYGQMDEFLMMINQIGNTSRLDIYSDVFMDRLHRTNYRARADRNTVGELMLVGILASLLLFVIAAVMRLRGSRLITAQRLTALEMTLHSFIWINMGVFILTHFQGGAMIIASPATWMMYCLPIATFYINILYLIPNLLMKRRWLLYLGSVAGLVAAFFMISLIAQSTFLGSLNLVSLDEQWDWIYTRDGLTYSGASESMLALQFALIPIALIYGLVRHLLLNRLPGLQRQKEALNAELNTLKHQISPHFFFNSLNTVYSFALSEESPQTADAITRLSDLMRFAIYQGDQDTIPLSTELEYLADYIELQRLRLNPVKHDLQYHVTGDPAQLKIAPLLLITLIENAFKHGISMTHESYINVDLFIQEKGLILTVENSVHPEVQLEGGLKTQTKVMGGVGLVNTQQRLDLLYKGRYDWQIDAQPDHYFTRLCLDLDA